MIKLILLFLLMAVVPRASARNLIPENLVGEWRDKEYRELWLCSDGRCIGWKGSSASSLGGYYYATYNPTTHVLTLTMRSMRGVTHDYDEHFNYDPDSQTLAGPKPSTKKSKYTEPTTKYSRYRRWVPDRFEYFFPRAPHE